MSVSSPTANHVTNPRNTHVLSVRNGQPRFVRNTSDFYGELQREPGRKVARERTESAPPELDFHDSDLNDKTSSFRKCRLLLKSACAMKSARSSKKLSVVSWNELDDYSDNDTDDEEESSKPRWDYDPKKLYTSLCEASGAVPCSAFLRQLETATMNLSHSYLTQRDIRIICHFLMNNATILELDVSGNDIGNHGARCLAEVIRENVFISDLNLSTTNLEAKGVHALVSALLINRTITKLNLSGSKLDHKHMPDLTRLIKENDYIIDLDLSHNELDELAACMLAPAIAMNVSLKRLILGWNHFRRTGATLIVKAICHNVELLEVDLSWNGLGEDGCRTFKNFLGDNHTLRLLDISNNRIAFQSLGYFIKGLVRNDTLTTLKLHGNPITTEGAEALCIALEHCKCTALKEVNIKDTPVDEKIFNAKNALQVVHNIKIICREPVGHRFSPIKQRVERKDFDPVVVLFEYMKQENLRLIDLFRNFDRDNSNSISKEEFKQGFMMMNIHLSDEGLDRMLRKMDKNKNAEIDLREMLDSKRETSRQQLKQGANVMQDERYKETVAAIKEQLAKGRNISTNGESVLPKINPYAIVSRTKKTVTR